MMKMSPANSRSAGIFHLLARPGHRRAFTGLLFLLVADICLNGCFSSSYLGRGGVHQPLPVDMEIRVTLYDNSVVKADPYRYLPVREPGDFAFGRGVCLNSRSGEKTEFNGSVTLAVPGPVDTADRPRSATPDAGKRSPVAFSHQLSDTVRVIFMPGEYSIVRRDQGTGLYCLGKRTAGGKEEPFEGRIPFSDISGIEEVHLDGGKTTWFVITMLLTAGIVAGMIALVEFEEGFSSWGGH